MIMMVVMIVNIIVRLFAYLHVMHAHIYVCINVHIHFFPSSTHLLSPGKSYLRRRRIWRPFRPPRNYTDIYDDA